MTKTAIIIGLCLLSASCIRNVLYPYVEPTDVNLSTVTVNLIENNLNSFGRVNVYIFEKPQLCEGMREFGQARKGFSKTKKVKAGSLTSLRLIYSEPGSYCDSIVSLKALAGHEYFLDYNVENDKCFLSVNTRDSNGELVKVDYLKRKKASDFTIFSHESKHCEPL